MSLLSGRPFCWKFFAQLESVLSRSGDFVCNSSLTMIALFTKRSYHHLWWSLRWHIIPPILCCVAYLHQVIFREPEANAVEYSRCLHMTWDNQLIPYASKISIASTRGKELDCSVTWTTRPQGLTRIHTPESRSRLAHSHNRPSISM
jgi:hypothetical protein